MSLGSTNLNGKRRLVSGTLIAGARGYSIMTESGDHWIVDGEDIDPALIGRHVTVEGTLAGPDRLKIDWIGEASS